MFRDELNFLLENMSKARQVYFKTSKASFGSTPALIGSTRAKAPAPCWAHSLLFVLILLVALAAQAVMLVLKLYPGVDIFSVVPWYVILLPVVLFFGYATVFFLALSYMCGTHPYFCSNSSESKLIFAIFCGSVFVDLWILGFQLEYRIPLEIVLPIMSVILIFPTICYMFSLLCPCCVGSNVKYIDTTSEKDDN